jgi:hypothetical protein
MGAQRIKAENITRQKLTIPSQNDKKLADEIGDNYLRQLMFQGDYRMFFVWVG